MELAPPLLTIVFIATLLFARRKIVAILAVFPTFVALGIVVAVFVVIVKVGDPSFFRNMLASLHLPFGN